MCSIYIFVFHLNICVALVGHRKNSCMCTLTEGIGNHSILIFCNSYKLIFGLYIDIDIDIISYIVWTEQKVVCYMAKIQKDSNSK
jgi:hypothetical protein